MNKVFQGRVVVPGAVKAEAVVSAMGAAPAALLFSGPIDSLAAAGAILADVWTPHSIPTVDGLGEEFLAYVQDGMTIEVAADGTVTVSDGK